jgi:large conductance mechanosensitive channel
MGDRDGRPPGTVGGDIAPITGGSDMLGEFKGFLTKTNALALAIGVIIGTALGGVVNSLVNDVIMPPIGFLLGGVDFSALKVVLKEAVGGDAKTEVAIRWGAFLNTVIAFIVIAFVVFWISKLLIREAEAAQSAPPEPSDEVKLLAEIRDELRKSAGRGA